MSQPRRVTLTEAIEHGYRVVVPGVEQYATAVEQRPTEPPAWPGVEFRVRDFEDDPGLCPVWFSMPDDGLFLTFDPEPLDRHPPPGDS